ncbi:hypothetical protein Tco_0411252 [Tanacetum coccineum]
MGGRLSVPAALDSLSVDIMIYKARDLFSFITHFGEQLKASTDTGWGGKQSLRLIDGPIKTITEASLRRHLKLEDHDGITSIPISEIFEKLALMGYQTDSDKLTFRRCLSPMEAYQRIYRGRNWVISYYAYFTYTFIFTIQGSQASPSLHLKPSTETVFEPQPSRDAEYHVASSNDSPLNAVHSHGILEDDLKRTKQTYSAAFTKLILRIKKLESKVKTGKARKRARVVLSEDEEDDSSKQGRIDEDPNTYFHQDNEVGDDVIHDTAKGR